MAVLLTGVIIFSLMISKLIDCSFKIWYINQYVILIISLVLMILIKLNIFYAEINRSEAIHRSSKSIWKLLTKFSTDTFAEGKWLRVSINNPNTYDKEFSVKVLRFKENEELCWVRQTRCRRIPWFFDRTQIFTIERFGEKGVFFIQKHVFTGLLATIFRLYNLLCSICESLHLHFPKDKPSFLYRKLCKMRILKDMNNINKEFAK